MNKKGTTMVEAAVVFPFVILTVIGIICILIFFYRQVETQANMHQALRQEAALISDTLGNQKKITRTFPIYQEKRKVRFEGDLLFKKQGILEAGGKVLQGSCYIVNQKKTALHFDFLKVKK